MAIQMFRPVYDVEACLEGIRDCLEKGWTGKGYKTVEFENVWKEYTGLSNAHFLTTGTAALNLAMETLKEVNGWQDGDEVISTPLTFVATNNCILYAKLKPVFADVDETLCLDPASVEARITDKTRAIIFVGMGGNIGRYHEIVEICRKHDLKLILDAAHMAGTRYHGEFPGKDADAVAFSFHVTKNLSTAEGGVLCFKDAALDKIVRDKSFNGISKPIGTPDPDMGGYDVRYLADSYNGNSIIAAIALAQIKHLDEENALRRKIAGMYDAAFVNNDKIKLVPIPEGCESARWLYQIVVEDRNGLMDHLKSKGIDCGVHYPVNTRYAMYADQRGMCPAAEHYSAHLLTLPLHILLSDKDIAEVIKAVLEYMEETT